MSGLGEACSALSRTGSHRHYATLALAVFSLVLGLISPLAGYAYSLFMLIVFTSKVTRLARRVYGVSLVLSVSAIGSSRAFFETQSDDYLRYYEVFESIAANNLTALFTFGGGLEVGLPTLYYFFYQLLGDINPETLMFLQVLILSLMFFFWLDKNIDRISRPSDRALVIAVSLMFFGVIPATQITRQSFAMVLLLYYFTSANRKFSFIFLALSSVFHLSGIFFAALYFFSKKFTKFSVFFAAVFAFITSLFLYEVVTIILGDGVIAGKLIYYLSDSSGDQINFLLSGLMALCFLSVILDRRCDSISGLKIFLVNLTLIFFAFLSYPLLSYRLTLIGSLCLFGIALYYTGRRLIIVYSTFALLFLVYRITQWSSPNEDDPFRLWAQFDLFGFPGYFLFNFF